MKKFGFFLLLAACFTFATEGSRSTQTARAKSACTPLLASQMQTDTATEFQVRDTAYSDGMAKGIGLGAGGALLFVGLIFQFKKHSHPDGTSEKHLSRAASA